MKIVHIITSLKIGGAESALVNFLTYAQRYDQAYDKEHHVIYFHAGPNVQAIKNLQIPTYHISGVISYCDPLALYRLYKLIRSIKPNIIHSSLWSANIIGRVFARYLKIPIICDLHGDCTQEGFIRNFFDRYTVSWADSIIAVSDIVKSKYLKNIILKPKASHAKNKLLHENMAQRVITIKNGIDAEALVTKATQEPLSRHDIGLNSHDFIIGAIGRLEPIKSYDLLVQAFALMLKRTTPEIIEKYGAPKLCIIGDGSEISKIQNLIKLLGLTNHVILTGFRTDAYRFYPLFDCFALSSQSEGLSIALLEALSFGLPIVTTHTNTEHEVITHAINGLLVPINSPEKLAQALIKIYFDKNLRTTIAQTNKILVQDAFDLTTNVQKYLTIYKELSKKKSTLEIL